MGVRPASPESSERDWLLLCSLAFLKLRLSFEAGTRVFLSDSALQIREPPVVV